MTLRLPRFPYSSRQYENVVLGAPAVAIENLEVAYPSTRRLALRDISLSVPIGARVAFVGANGAGKSTLLKAIAGLLPIAAGSIRIFGNAPGGCHHRVAYLPQRGEIDWRFPISLRRLVLTGRYVHLGWLARPSQRDWEIVDTVIAQLGLSDLRERQIGQLSGGQQQRALLARALAQQADLLLLDEPLNAVDVDTREMIATTLTELRRQGKTVITATHDLGRLEADFDSAVYLSEGKEIAPPPGSFVGKPVGDIDLRAKIVTLREGA